MQARGDRGREERARRSGERTLRIPPSRSFPVSHAGGPHVRIVRLSVVRACACERACARAGVAQCATSRKGKRPAKKTVGTLNKKKALRVLRGRRGRWERRVRSCIKREALCAGCGAKRTEGELL